MTLFKYIDNYNIIIPYSGIYLIHFINLINNNQIGLFINDSLKFIYTTTNKICIIYETINLNNNDIISLKDLTTMKTIILNKFNLWKL